MRKILSGNICYGDRFFLLLVDDAVSEEDCVVYLLFHAAEMEDK